MSGEENGLTLQGLARRLETLERENAELRHKVATLEGSGTRRSEVAVLRASGTNRDGEPVAEFDGRVSRRGLLSKAGAAAAGLVVAGALTQRDIREAQAAIVQGTSEAPDRGAVEGINANANGFGVWGRGGGSAVGGIGVSGTHGKIGVYGESNYISDNAHGVQGYKSDTNIGGGAGVYGENVKGDGVQGVGNGGGSGVYGRGRPGVRGESSAQEGVGVRGETAGDFARGVFGRTTGFNGQGVSGEGLKGTGVLGTGKTGVAGMSTGTGYGGYFEGGKAQLRIMPSLEGGRPTTGSHFKGEIYMDTAGKLFVCIGTGIPGKWRKVSTTAV
jgi:hypothetical protein